jgi:photosystem II stability/assembly factor-like uncharacterized protein
MANLTAFTAAVAKCKMITTMASVSIDSYDMRRLILIPLLAILTCCSGQPNSGTKTASVSGDIPPVSSNNPSEIADGIIYFSTDNGLSWKNKSAGLPAKISIGLGGIAVSGNRLAVATKDSGLYLFDSRQARWVKTPTDKQLIESNPGALIFYKDHIYIGTQFGGIFYSQNEGKTWTKLNTGLSNLTIRKLAVIDDRLYAGTNAGLYAYDDSLSQWQLEYGSGSLQVNGIAAFEENIYIGSSQGAFSSPKDRNDWKKVFASGALHNISADDKALYAMVYNELFSSVDKGKSWQSIQEGLPAQLYTFNVIKNGNAVFAGQWDGVYRKDNAMETWRFSSNGLPGTFAITNMQVYNGIIVVSGSERKLREGMTTDK